MEWSGPGGWRSGLRGVSLCHCAVVWCGVLCCGVVSCGVVWCRVVWCGVVWCGVLRCVALCCVVLRCVVLWFVVLCCWWPLEVRSIAVVLIGVCHGGGVGMWAGGFITWGGFWFVFLQSRVFHPVSQHLSACMFSLKIPCRRVWVQTLCCDFECLVFDRNKYLMMMMMIVLQPVDHGPTQPIWTGRRSQGKGSTN